MRIVRTSFVLVLLFAAQSRFLAAQSAATLGEALFAAGFGKTVWVSYDNVAVRLTGTFNPSAPWLGDGASFELRYGAGSWHQKGNVVGERYSDDLLYGLVHHSTNPLGLSNPANYVLGPQDRQDAVMVSRGGGRAVWDDYLLPLAAALAPEPEPQPEPICPPFSPQVCFAP